MPAMPAWLIPLVIKYGPTIVSLLIKMGLMKQAEGVAIKIGMKVLKTADETKFYYEPKDFPSPPPSPTPHNFNKGE